MVDFKVGDWVECINGSVVFPTCTVRGHKYKVVEVTTQGNIFVVCDAMEQKCGWWDCNNFVLFRGPVEAAATGHASGRKRLWLSCDYCHKVTFCEHPMLTPMPKHYDGKWYCDDDRRRAEANRL